MQIGMKMLGGYGLENRILRTLLDSYIFIADIKTALTARMGWVLGEQQEGGVFERELTRVWSRIWQSYLRIQNWCENVDLWLSAKSIDRTTLMYSQPPNSCPASTDIFLCFIALSRYCRSSSVMFG